MLGNVDKGDVGAFVLSLLSEREGVVKERRFWCICWTLVLAIVLDVGAFVFLPLSDREDVVKKYETLITSSSSSLSILLVTNDVVVVRKLCSQGFLAAVAYLARTKLETKEFCAIAMA